MWRKLETGDNRPLLLQVANLLDEAVLKDKI